MRVAIIGSGPAGSAAAFAARRHGAGVNLVEKSRLPRHKVCGEFLSPEIVPLLEDLCVSGRFADAAPARVRRVFIRFGRREKCAVLSEPAYGLSRFVFDKLLFDAAVDAGAVSTESAPFR